MLRDGILVEEGVAGELVRDPGAEYTRELVAAVPVLPEAAPGEAALPETAPQDGALTEERGGPESGLTTARPVLAARGLEVRYSGRPAITGVELALGPGDALGVVGESGSGKSTLARALAGQLSYAAGEILLDGRSLPAHRSREERLAVQLVPQDPYSSLDPRMSVGQTLTELLVANRIVARAEAAARVFELLELVRLAPAIAAARPHELSGGQRQRVALARALAVRPRVIIADEPTSALDVSVQASVISLLGRLRRELGLALVLVSHDLAVVHELCDSVIVVRDGRIVESGDARFFAAPATAYGRNLLAAVPRLPL